ncbi:Protein of unknown function, partial [Cotesia congregata]
CIPSKLILKTMEPGSSTRLRYLGNRTCVMASNYCVGCRLRSPQALDLVGEWLVLFGPAGPEVTKFSQKFTRKMLEDPGTHQQFFTPNLSKLERLRQALADFVLDRYYSRGELQFI